MPTSTATPQYITGQFQRMVQLNITGSADTASIVIPHGIVFSDNTATSVIAGLLQVVFEPNGTAAAASQPLWFVSAKDATNITLTTFASGASALGGAGNYALWMSRIHSIGRLVAIIAAPVLAMASLLV